ncbi:M-phase phosphoprotein 6 [Epargyreus clarus]|uniref:M-phase phosphoprotein 6 n=1 Tax=Epargyreus clarus TaxID=520877 RepID=UPI003C2C2D18
MATKKKPQLPKSLLEMKFMKKTKERMEKEYQNLEDHDKLYSETLPKEVHHDIDNYITQSSFIYCEDLLEGRISFKGMNPEIERLMAAEAETAESEGEMHKDVPDEILAKKMNSFRRKRRNLDTPSKYSIIKKKK